MRKKRILFSTYYGANDIANFNCAHGPFSQMEDVEIVVPTALEFDPQTLLNSRWWTNFRWWLGVDVCFVHRPYGFYGQQILAACKSHGIPTWVHHDDDLLAIPQTNPYYEGYVLQDREHPSIEESYKQANILTCQSVLMQKMLKEKYERPDTVLIPIALDNRLLHLKKHWSNNNRICWRGSDSHRHDLLSFKVELQEVFDKYQDREFHFFILNPRELGFKVKNLVMHEGLPMFEFYRRICKINASYAMVLLEDNHFNRVKSHLAWLDHTLAGSVVLGPDFPEFQRPGISNNLRCEYGYLDCDSSKYNEESWKEIQSKYVNSVTNEIRRNILNAL